MLNWLRKWWNPEPVYSEIGQRIFELLESEEAAVDVKQSRFLTVDFPKRGIQVWNCVGEIKIWTSESERTQHQPLTEWDHKRLKQKMKELHQKANPKYFNGPDEEFVRNAIGLESKQ